MSQVIAMSLDDAEKLNAFLVKEDRLQEAEIVYRHIKFAENADICSDVFINEWDDVSEYAVLCLIASAEQAKIPHRVGR